MVVLLPACNLFHYTQPVSPAASQRGNGMNFTAVQRGAHTLSVTVGRVQVRHTDTDRCQHQLRYFVHLHYALYWVCVWLSSNWAYICNPDQTRSRSFTSLSFQTCHLFAVFPHHSSWFQTADDVQSYVPTVTSLPYLFWKITKINRAFRKYG